MTPGHAIFTTFALTGLVLTAGCEQEAPAESAARSTAQTRESKGDEVPACCMPPKVEPAATGAAQEAQPVAAPVAEPEPRAKAPAAAIQLEPDPKILRTLIATRPNLDLTFTNQDGRPVNLKSIVDEGKTLVVSTFFTACPMPDMCPRLTRDFGWLSKQIPQDLRDDIRLVLVSFDPQNDNPDVLKAYGQTHGIDFGTTDLVVGSIDTTRVLLEDALGIDISVNPMTNQIITHAMLVHVVNSDGYIVVERTADETADLEAVAREMVRAATIEFDPEAAKAVWARERGG